MGIAQGCFKSSVGIEKGQSFFQFEDLIIKINETTDYVNEAKRKAESDYRLLKLHVLFYLLFSSSHMNRT